MPDFSKRSTEPEMMDDFSLGQEVINPIMDELEVVNKLLGGYQVFFSAFRNLAIKDGMTISDWGCGGGDSLRILARWAREKKLKLHFVGVDATATAIDFAKEKARDYPEITFIHADVLSDKLQSRQFDIVISSLFTHHFENGDWIKLIQKMLDCCTHAVVVNDLHRHWFAYRSIGMLTQLFSKSEMVKHDSKLSVLRGFTAQELKDLLEQAGIVNYSLKWMWAFRWQLIIYKDHGSPQT
ncbi:methyltransferase domain-containing protein [Paradesertivirga mongoliensis]|uniref:Methyltransferase domain-containing protein n=1 Tax=Paradesertivirga mongoliensis TaxID=2100740 RepID=A0ABW4ZJP3_9SPHI|nr:methyltransferase domain-containing protein [Pedobacter mongoliensis]